MKKIKTQYGKAIIIKDEDGVRIDSIEIKKEYRRKGHGRDLLVKAIAAAKKIAENEIFIVADSDDESFNNADLVEFYKSEGFCLFECESYFPVLKLDV